jgi:hypothetical protein
MNKFSIRCAILAALMSAATHAGASGNEETWPELSLVNMMKAGVGP